MTRCAVVATARPTFVMAAGERFAVAARGLLTELGVDVQGPDELVTTLDQARAARDSLDRAVEWNVLLCATFSDAGMAEALYGDSDVPVLLWACREPGQPGDRLWLNSLCGANLAAHALVRRDVPVRLLYGDPGEPRVRERLAAALSGEIAVPAVPQHDGAVADERTVRASLAALRGSTIGLVGDEPPGFTPCEADPAGLDELLGIQLRPLALQAAFAAARAVPAGQRQREVAAAAQATPSIRDLDADQVDRGAAVTESLRQWTGDTGLAALAVRCWPEFPTELGVCPCSSLGRLQDAGVPATCERDVNGAATMLLAASLGGGRGYLMDLVELGEQRNLVRFWHCGSAPISLAADPEHATQSVHCNRRIGVAGDFALRPGRVTISRLSRSRDGFRLLVTGGEALDAPNRFQGNTVDVRLDAPAEQFVTGLVEHGFEHHTVLSWADVRPELRRVARLLGIPLYEW